MRKIFNKLPPTPKPCLKEEAEYEKWWDAWYANEKKLLKLESDITVNEASLKQIADDLTKNSTAKAAHVEKMKKTQEEILKKQELIKKTSYFNDRILYNQLYYEKKILETTKDDQIKLDKLYETQIKFLKDREALEIKSLKLRKEIQVIDKELSVNLKKLWQLAFSDFNDCLISRKPALLNLNSSFKEIKQKIKIINQKLISPNNKLINLNHGILSLNVLNINKNLSHEKIKITKEFLVKLDNLKPISSQKLNNITPNSSFDVIYKKAQNDLSSYKEERKIFISKIKTSEEKIKTISEKKKKLKAQISNLIKKFAKPPLIQN